MRTGEQPETCAAAPEQSLSRLIMRLGRAHRGLGAELLGDCGLHVGQEQMLFLLDRAPRAMGDLARTIGVEPPTVTKMVARLQRAGLVHTSASPEDGRLKLVELTDAGRAALVEARARWERLEAITRSALDDDDRDRFAGLLAQVAEALEGASSEERQHHC